MNLIWPVDWTAVGGIGQIAAAVAAAVAAFYANRAASRSERLARENVDAARRQTEANAIQRLLEKYSSHEMYLALFNFGKHVHHPSRNFSEIQIEFEKSNRYYDATKELPLQVKEALDEIRKDPKLDSARRLIQHYFKLVWAYRRAQVLSDEDLLLATEKQSGYALWRRAVLPMSAALWHRLASHDRNLPPTEEWTGELIAWIDKAMLHPTSE